ncbi:MAG: hypothetical protein GXY55_21425 [Phycisphaerae bacterium]|nr:hypothetical protein [Phycisphaerae bacterium]
MPSTEQNKTAVIIKLGLVALAFAGAVFFTMRGRGDDEARQLDTPESARPYICLDDGHVFQVTPADFKRLTEKLPPDDHGGNVLVIPCPTTGQVTATPAEQCPNDQTYFPLRQKNGKFGKCPKCGWSRHGH